MEYDALLLGEWLTVFQRNTVYIQGEAVPGVGTTSL